MTAFLDANVFAYASGSPHPLRDSCRAIVSRVTEGSLAATTSVEVLQEVLHLYDRRSRRAEALVAIGFLLTLFPSVLPVTRADVERAAELFARHGRLSSRDAIHAATMLNNGLTDVISADRHFDLVPGIRRIDPLAAAAAGDGERKP